MDFGLNDTFGVLVLGALWSLYIKNGKLGPSTPKTGQPSTSNGLVRWKADLALICIEPGGLASNKHYHTILPSCFAPMLFQAAAV